MSSNPPESVRVCVVAEHASFRFGGEASLPLHYFSRLRARNIEAWLVVHDRTRPELEALFPNDKDRIHFVRDAWFHHALLALSGLLPRRIAEATSGLLSGLINQWLQRRIIRDLIARFNIELIHQVIPVSPRFPSLIYGFKVPVIVGPMNGGMDYPPAFKKSESLLTRIIVRSGRSMSYLGNLLIPGKRRARLLLVANERTRMALACDPDGDVVELVENGVDLDTWTPPRNPNKADASARFVFVGRLVNWKCVDVALEAIARIPGASLEIIGDGSTHDSCERLVRKLGIESRVTFSGWLPQTACAERLHTATALLLPSIYECGGAVVLEAMAASVPVIATRWGGPADYLDDSCGFLIKPTNREALVQGFADAMRQLIEFTSARAALGQGGRSRVEKYFTWDGKIDRILEIYGQALGTSRTTKPERELSMVGK